MCARVFLENGNTPLTCRQMLEQMGYRWKRIPTSNQLANTMAKCGYFEKNGMVKQDYTVSARGSVNVWTMKRDKCYTRGWLNLPFENRPVDDPMHEGTDTRYNHAGVLIQPKK